jgi:hypothetical protein
MFTCDFVGELKRLTICTFVYENIAVGLLISVLSVVVLHTRFPREFVDPYSKCLGSVIKPINMGG